MEIACENIPDYQKITQKVFH